MVCNFLPCDSNQLKFIFHGPWQKQLRNKWTHIFHKVSIIRLQRLHGEARQNLVKVVALADYIGVVENCFKVHFSGHLTAFEHPKHE